MIPRSWREIAPGAYLDHEDSLHLVVEELLRVAGVSDTPENRRTLIEETRRILARDYPDTEILVE